MFWKLKALSTSSPVESLLDKENITLEELLDEEDIIQECKRLNSRLVNFLRDRPQVEQLLKYIIEESQESVDSKHTFKFPFIACEIFTCEIDVIFKTLVEEEELMNLLFSFLEPTRPHSPVLAGYFSKVVTCLMLRKTIPLMNYVQTHEHILQQLVDLIGITSIKEVLVRLVGADDHMYPNHLEVMQWLADGNFLEMIVDKLNPSNPSEVNANSAETLCAITQSASSPLAIKLSSPSYVTRIFGHALEDSHSKSGLLYSLTVCISLLDPRKSAPSSFNSFRGQHVYKSPVQVNQETVGAMLPKLGDLLKLLNVSLDENFLPTSYGQLTPPLGKHRLKIVEFIAVLLKTGNQTAEKELITSGTIQRVLDLFFEYPFNNALHHHVENIIYCCLESKNDSIIDHLFQDCGLTTKILQTENCPTISGELNQPTLAASGRNAPRVGNLGHVTHIANKIMQLGTGDIRIQTHLKENSEWNEWHTTVLQERNAIENVYRWACGRPSALQDRSRDSDEDDRDYDVAALANNISEAFKFKYNIYDNEESEEVHGTDGYFDDESAEVVISSLRLGDDQGMFTNSKWFDFEYQRMGDDVPMGDTSTSEQMDEIKLDGTSNGSNNSSDDEVVVGDNEDLYDNENSKNGTFISKPNPFQEDSLITDEKAPSCEKKCAPVNEELYADSPMPEVAADEPEIVSGSGLDASPFLDYKNTPSSDVPTSLAVPSPNSTLNECTAGDTEPLKTVGTP